MSDAFNLAMKPRRGPVCVNLPRNILAASNTYNINTKKPSFTNENKQKGNKENIKKAAKLIGSSKCSVIIVGAGIKYNSKYKEVIKLAELCNLPIVTAAGHGDAIPFGHKLNAGQMGPRGNPVASKLVKNADVILAIGTRLGFNSTFYSYENINKNAKIIQIELEKTMLGKYFPVKVKIHADAATATKQLYEEIKKEKIKFNAKDWTNSYLKERKEYLINRNKENLGTNFPIQPKGLFKQLRKVLPKNSAITLDAGTLCLQATDALEYYDPPFIIYSIGFWFSWFFFCMWSWSQSCKT